MKFLPIRRLSSGPSRPPKDVNFVINVADSFYPDGVSSKDDPQWEVKWRQVYSPQVRAWVSWFLSYGVHFGCP